MKLKKLVVLVALALGVSSAHGIPFDATSVGGAAFNFDAFDWTQTSFFAQNGQTAIGAFISDPTCPNNSCDFTVYTHATLQNFTLGGSAVNGTGINTDFELTMVAKFTETVTGIAGSTALFTSDPAKSSFFEIWIDPAQGNANVLTGSGYNNGTRILTGVLGDSVVGNFSVTNNTPVNLDGSGANNYTGQMTVSGFGGNGNIPVNVLSFDPTFFTGGIAALSLDFNNISIGLPYGTTNPSNCFNPAANGVTPCLPGTYVNGLFSAQTVVQGLLPSIGATNGLFGNVSPDFVAQTDYNASVIVAVPEPGTLALLGGVLAGIGLGGYRRKLPT